MRGARVVLAVAAFSWVGLAACVKSAPLEGRPCPCEDGYLCCVPTGVCVAAASCTPGDLNACAHADEPNASNAMIANFESGSSDVTGGGVKGSWFVYSDNDAGVGEVSRAPEPLPTPVCGSSLALHVRASGFSRWGSGVGFALRSTNDKNAPFDARDHAGIRFWLKSARSPLVSDETQRLHLDFYDEHNADAVTDCARSDTCMNYFTLDTPAENAWTEYAVRFSELTDASTLGLDQLYTVQWTMPSTDASASYDYWLDDVAWLDD